MNPGAGEPGVSIVIPAWNEENRLARTLERYLPSLEARVDSFEVIVVVDGSTDSTAASARRYSDRGVRVLEFPTRLGKGGAIAAGFHEARYEFVGFLDADGPVPPSDVFDMVELLRECDGVVASRWLAGSKITSPQGSYRFLLGRCWNLLVRVLLFLPVHDTQCGAKFFKKSVVIPILNAVVVTDWAFDVDLLYHMNRAGLAVHEMPVTWTDVGGSKLSIGEAVPSMLASLLGIWIMSTPLGGKMPSSWIERFRRLRGWFQSHS